MSEIMRNVTCDHISEGDSCGLVATLIKQNAKLRELVEGIWYCAHDSYGMCARVPVGCKRPFACCPLYDFDAKECRCEKLLRELGFKGMSNIGIEME